MFLFCWICVSRSRKHVWLLKWIRSRIRKGSFVLFNAGSSELSSISCNLRVFVYVMRSGVALKRTECLPFLTSDFFSMS